MRNITLGLIIISTITASGACYGILSNIDTKNYVIVEIDTLDRIMIETSIDGSNPKLLFTYGKTSTVYEEKEDCYNVVINIRKIIDQDNPIIVTVTDQDSNVLFHHVFLGSKIKIDLEEIVSTRAINY